MMAGEAIPGPQHELESGADYGQFVSAIPLMVRMARFGATNEAISYRDFHVGASAYAIKFDGSKPPVTLGGANYKPDQQTPKYCAEMDVVDHLEGNDYDQIVGSVVAGTTDPKAIKAVMGRVTPTLHPCHACQDKMAGSRLVTPDTIVITVGLENDVAQIHTFDDLQMIYELEERQGAQVMAPPVDLDLSNWARREQAFDVLMQMSADNDPVSAAQLVLSSTVALDS